MKDCKRLWDAVRDCGELWETVGGCDHNVVKYFVRHYNKKVAERYIAPIFAA